MLVTQRAELRIPGDGFVEPICKLGDSWLPAPGHIAIEDPKERDVRNHVLETTEDFSVGTAERACRGDAHRTSHSWRYRIDPPGTGVSSAAKDS